MGRYAWILLVLPLLGAGCLTHIDDPASGVEFCVRKSVIYPPLPVGNTSVDSIFLTSCSIDPVHIERVILNADDSDVFTLIRAFDSLTIKPGDTVYQLVRFTAHDSAEHRGSVLFVSNAGTVSTSLLGTAIGKQNSRDISVPSIISVGNARVGVCQDSNLGKPHDTPFWIRNTGSETVHLKTPLGSSSFSLLPFFKDSIAKGDSLRVYVRFCPKRYGKDSAQIQIRSDANDSVKTIKVEGIGTTYVPAEGSTWSEEHLINNDPTGTVTKRVYEEGDSLRRTGSTTFVSDLDTAFYVNTFDTLYPRFRASGVIPVRNKEYSPVHEMRFPTQLLKPSTAITFLDEDTLDVTRLFDTITFVKQEVITFGDTVLRCYTAKWVRVVRHGGYDRYNFEAMLHYFPHLGMIFLSSTTEALEDSPAPFIDRAFLTYKFK